ncbi:hypothetical protein COJ21_09820 [Priestia megaterium]|uniref:SHOCT domain-containing protein n=1 Tax=Priestia megaterium TaxID=1404 RepID=UPI000BF6213B|nr:SHOCT domain-containing protein [Priestia megaterium]PFK77409.1 hypothetical protein COJ21_09820 [Priestia megaterium]
MFIKREQTLAHETRDYIEGIVANKNNVVASPVVQETKVDPVDEIRRYKELADEGIITEEEFLQKNK